MSRLRELRLFLVEDELFILLDLEDTVRDWGCEVVAMASRLDEAMRLVEDGLSIDMAILDLNLDGDMSYPIADRLRSRHVPIVFATAYGAAGVDKQYHDAPIVQKPYSPKALEAAVRRSLEPALTPQPR